jgi:hypothetical protein
MRAGVRVSLIAGAVSILTTVPAVGAAAAGSRRVKLEGMGYLKARSIILSYGWKPLLGHCEADESACDRYPEIEACSCCGTAPCAMVFVKQNRCLGVGTIGGPPQPEEADAVVTDVRFMRGHCSKH